MRRSNLLLAALGLLATTAVAQPAQPTADPRPLIDGLVLDVLGTNAPFILGGTAVAAAIALIRKLTPANSPTTLRP